MIHLKLRVRGKTYNLIAMNRNLNVEALLKHFAIAYFRKTFCF